LSVWAEHQEIDAVAGVLGERLAGVPGEDHGLRVDALGRAVGGRVEQRAGAV
jgi:hypothetical protein